MAKRQQIRKINHHHQLDDLWRCFEIAEGRFGYHEMMLESERRTLKPDFSDKPALEALGQYQAVLHDDFSSSNVAEIPHGAIGRPCQDATSKVSATSLRYIGRRQFKRSDHHVMDKLASIVASASPVVDEGRNFPKRVHTAADSKISANQETKSATRTC